MGRALTSVRIPPRLWSGTAKLLGARGVATICSVLSLAILARALEPAEFGRLTFYLALLALLHPLVDCGTSTAALQRGSADREILLGAIRAGRSIRLVAALLAALIVATAVLALGEQDALWICAAALLMSTRALELSSLVYHSDLRWSTPTKVRIGSSMLRLGSIALLSACGLRTFGPYLLAAAGARASADVVLHLSARSELRGTSSKPPVQTFLRASLPLAAIAILQEAYFYADNGVVRWFLGDAPLGFYNAAVRVFGFAILPVAIGTNVALPWLVRRARAGELRSSVRKLTLIACSASLIPVAALWVAAPDLLSLLFGGAFGEATWPLRWLLLGAVAIYAGAPALTGLLARSANAAVFAITLGALLFNLTADFLLVPRLGIEGAALGTFGTELFVTLAAILVLWSSEKARAH